MRETRTATLDAADVRDDTSTDAPAFRFTGHAAVFDQRTWIGHPKLGFWEVIERGFFDDVLGDQTAFLVNHDPNHILARNGNTMTLAVDERGLVPEADWDPEDPEARMWASRVRRGDVTRMSFAFTVADGGDTWTRGDDGTETRTLTRAGRLYDVSLVTHPAYDGTDASMRDQADAILRRHRELTQTSPRRQAARDRLIRYRYRERLARHRPAR